MPEVTLAIDGETLVLDPGQRFLLNLGGDYNWTVQVTDLSVLSRVPNVSTITGSQGLFEAHQRGTTVLTADGEPVCRQAQVPCDTPAQMFRLQVVVQ